VPNLCSLLSSEDIITQYSCVIALKRIVKSDHTRELDLNPILSAVIPPIINICDKIHASHLVWPIISVLTNIMEKIDPEGPFNGLDQLAQMNLNQLLQKNDKLIRSGLMDMFKSVILAFPIGAPLTFVYQTCLNLVAICLPMLVFHRYRGIGLLVLYYEGDAQSAGERKCHQKHFGMLNEFFLTVVKSMKDSTQLDFAIDILKESVLLSLPSISFK
jgi:hypothetical protein